MNAEVLPARLKVASARGRVEAGREARLAKTAKKK